MILPDSARAPSGRLLDRSRFSQLAYTSQVADVIRRDPSMTTRLLRVVNSVYYGLSTPVSSIEEAVFYLGVRQIRRLAVVTPVIEDLQKLAGRSGFP